MSLGKSSKEKGYALPSVAFSSKADKGGDPLLALDLKMKQSRTILTFRLERESEGNHKTLSIILS
jgi:hypothetical protein